MKKIALLILVTFFLKTPQAKAWGNKGHKIVAQIAKSCLEKQVVDSVEHYLAGVSFEDASVWMDEVRGNHDFDFMKPMHYVNIEKDKTYVKVSEPNIVNQLDLVISQLKNRKGRTKDEIKLDLLMLFHLVGDIHQPLHTGYSGDKGGNAVDVDFLGTKSNLHRVWDTNIIEEEKITTDTCMKILHALPANEKKEIAKVDVMTWVSESRNALPYVYSLKDNTVTKAYVDSAKPIVEKSLTRAGIRLASVLDEAFGKGSEPATGKGKHAKKN